MAFYDSWVQKLVLFYQNTAEHVLEGLPPFITTYAPEREGVSYGPPTSSGFASGKAA